VGEAVMLCRLAELRNILLGLRLIFNPCAIGDLHKINMIKYAFMVLLLTSCCVDEKPCYTSNEIVVAKFSKDFPEIRKTIYKIATNTGFDSEVSYGYYIILNVGDTVLVKYCDGFHFVKPLKINP
jgi:hypothetical protein